MPPNVQKSGKGSDLRMFFGAGGAKAGSSQKTAMSSTQRSSQVRTKLSCRDGA